MPLMDRKQFRRVFNPLPDPSIDSLQGSTSPPKGGNIAHTNGGSNHLSLERLHSTRESLPFPSLQNQACEVDHIKRWR